MKNKSLLILTSITLVIIVAAMISTRNRAPQTSVERPTLSQELSDQVNNISQIIMESQAQSVHISKQGNNWSVMQADNYPAKFDKVKKLVLDVADLNILSQKTSNPELFGELGVQDPREQNSSSLQLTMLDGSGNAVIAIILGDKRAADGQYVRITDSNNTYLVDGQPAVSADPKDWIQTDLLDIDDERVSDVTINHPNGEIITLTRPDNESDFELQGIPEDMQAQPDNIISGPGTFLSNLTIQNAINRETFNFPGPQVITTIKTFDGLIATIHSAQTGAINYATIDFAVDESSMPSGSGSGARNAIVIGEKEEPTEEDVRKEVETLNDKTRNWVFIIPQYRYSLLTKRMEDLTDPVVSDNEA